MAQLRARAGAASLLVAVATAGIWIRRRWTQRPPEPSPGEPPAASHGTARSVPQPARVDIVTVVDDLLGAAG
jgi:hypothetical protein